MSTKKVGFAIFDKFLIAVRAEHIIADLGRWLELQVVWADADTAGGAINNHTFPKYWLLAGVLYITHPH